MGLGSPEGPACQRTARQCGRAHASPMPDDQGSSETATTSPFLYHWLQAPFFFAPLMSITYAQLNKKACNRPTLSVYGLGGFTPIANTVPVYEFGGTAGQRFGAEKRFGIMVSGSYDYNGRGIDDVEPVPGILAGTSFTPYYSSMAIREYLYHRK